MADDKSQIRKIASWLPVTLDDLRRHTLASMLFLCLIVITILYRKSDRDGASQRQDCANEVKELKSEVKQLRTEVSFWVENGRRSDSALADVKATLKVLKQYYKIE